VDSAIHLLNNRGLAKISIPYLQFLLLNASLRLSLDFYVAPLLSLFVAHDRSTIATVIVFSTYVQTEPNATSIQRTPPLRGHPGGTPLYKPYRYVPPHRVGFLRRFGLKTGTHFAYYGLESGRVFDGTRECMNACIFSIPN